MPIILDPDRTFDVWLDSDEDKPIDSRPTFMFKYMTAREWMEISDFKNSLEDAKSLTQVVEPLAGKITKTLVGWRNMGDHAFNKDTAESDLLDILTAGEMFDLMVKVSSMIRLQESDAKK